MNNITITIKSTLRQFFIAEIDTLAQAEKAAQQAQINLTIQRKTAKQEKTIRKYEILAENAQAYYESAQTDMDIFLKSDIYTTYVRAEKLAIKAVKKLATGSGYGADLARDIWTKYNFHHDIFACAVQTLAAEIIQYTDHYTTSITADTQDNSALLDRQLADISWLGITFTDYIYAPKKTGDKTYRWVSPTKNYLAGYVNKYIRNEGKLYDETKGAGEYASGNEILAQTSELTNSIDKSFNDTAFQAFTATLKADNAFIVHKVSEGLTFTEIANILGVTQQAISQRWYGIADKYRKYLNTAYTA